MEAFYETLLLYPQRSWNVRARRSSDYIQRLKLQFEETCFKKQKAILLFFAQFIYCQNDFRFGVRHINLFIDLAKVQIVNTKAC